ncbi:hypothetical protein MTP99_007553 [Tenebrio molitor]|nr:hypothetical protein MTP99_007553 [Tenebrio molitor]
MRRFLSVPVISRPPCFPSYEYFAQYLSACAKAQENIEGYGTPRKPSWKPTQSTPTQSFHQKGKPAHDCACCLKPHFIVFCPMFRQYDAKERLDWVIQQHLCFNCLDPHNAYKYQSPHVCKKCSEKHLTMLHDSPYNTARSTYVDDIGGGADSLQQLSAIAEELTAMCKTACLPLAKWKSNHQDFIMTSSEPSSEQSHSFEDLTTKTLGIPWQCKPDTLTFKGNLNTHNICTKRAML